MSSDSLRVTAKDELLRIAAYFRRIGDLWEGPDGVGTRGTDLCQRIAQDAYSLAHERMALGLTAIPPIAAAEARADSAVPSSHVSDVYDGVTTHPEFGNQAQAVAGSGAAASAITVPEGWVLVPIEPTPEMCSSGWPAYDAEGAGLAWSDMVAAAPEPPLGAAAPPMSTASAPANSETDEWKLVPLEPTDAMAAAAVKAALAAPRQLNGVNYWRAMIAASPVAPESSNAILREALARLVALHDVLPEELVFEQWTSEMWEAWEAARSALAGMKE